MNKEQINQKKYSLMSCQTKSILLGSILGDGSLKIHKGYKNARFQFVHSLKFKDYFFWKREQVKKDLSSLKDFWEVEELDPQSKKSFKLRYQSRCLDSLTYLHDLIHKKSKDGSVRIRRKWLNMLDEQALAIWWCDDGSLVSNTRQGVFCTDGFLFEDLLILSKYLKKVWNIEVKIISTNKLKKNGKLSYRLWIRNHLELRKFLKIIIPFIPVKSMLYKVLLLWKDPDLQQRWISEVEKLSYFDKDVICQVIKERKESLKYFRKKR